MEFDFYNEYKDYSNVALLKIIKRPDIYQAAAITAAGRILEDRNITEAEISETEEYFQTIQANEQQKKDQIISYREKAADFLQPVLQPTQEVNPTKWLNIFLFVMALQYIWTFFISVRHLVKVIALIADCRKFGFVESNRSASLFTCIAEAFNIMILVELFTLIYIPLIFYLLYKKMRWGWIMLFADNLFIFLSSVIQSYIFFKYQSVHGGDTGTYLFQIALRGVFVFFLWQDMIAGYFNIASSTKRKTAIITALITLLFVFGLQLFI